MIQIFEYESSPIQFEVIDGQVMANATLMAKAFNKKPDDIFRTKTWKEFENAVMDDTELRFEDIRTVKNGDAGGSWIHQELVLEFSRRLNTKFSLWCNRMIAELLKSGTVSIKPKSTAEQLLDSAKVMVEHEQRLSLLESRIENLEVSKSRATRQVMALPLSNTAIPEQSDRTKILRLVNGYCRMTGISSHDTWSKLYADLYYLYNISVRAYKKRPDERTYLDVIERLGHLDKLHALISAMIYDLDQMAS
ncbi:KilA-N domain-containing protein [Dyadobacter sp. CY261]|uniref:KilA-N domain-containing protein n=1 Tax=Dyadobacter sp. CY261 TaxID=2907203 RepID=UPI001F158D55|nr:KilA-N domain-containing protein [Dyadobacter sp. CY261]MCF0070245.1 KilA-N domain-containing protein [Dyadobacter sp. CY261]